MVTQITLSLLNTEPHGLDSCREHYGKSSALLVGTLRFKSDMRSHHDRANVHRGCTILAAQCLRRSLFQADPGAAAAELAPGLDPRGLRQ